MSNALPGSPTTLVPVPSPESSENSNQSPQHWGPWVPRPAGALSTWRDCSVVGHAALRRLVGFVWAALPRLRVRGRCWGAVLGPPQQVEPELSGSVPAGQLAADQLLRDVSFIPAQRELPSADRTSEAAVTVKQFKGTGTWRLQIPSRASLSYVVSTFVKEKPMGQESEGCSVGSLNPQLEARPGRVGLTRCRPPGSCCPLPAACRSWWPS